LSINSFYYFSENNLATEDTEDTERINKKFLQGPGAVFSKRAPGRRRHHAPWSIEPDTGLNKFLTLITDQSGAAACCPPEAFSGCHPL